MHDGLDGKPNNPFRNPALSKFILGFNCVLVNSLNVRLSVYSGDAAAAELMRAR